MCDVFFPKPTKPRAPGVSAAEEALESSYELCFNAACALIDEGRLKEAEAGVFFLVFEGDVLRSWTFLFLGF